MSKNHKKKEDIVAENLQKKYQELMSKQIYKKPVWEASSLFNINGRQLEEIATLAAAFRPIVELSDHLIRSGELEGTVKTDYIYADGTTVPDSDPRIAEMREAGEKELNDMRKQVEEYQAKIKEIQDAAKKAGGKTAEEVVKETEKIEISN